MKVYVHLATGFEEIEAVTVIDVLRRAGIDTESVSVTGDLSVKGAHGITVEADLLFDSADYKNCGMIVLPGGMPGTTNLGAHEGLMREIRAFAAQGKYLAAICAAPMVFGEAGLLQGKKAVIYPGMEAHLKGALVGKGAVESDDKIITSKGPGTAYDFAFAIVETIKGAEAAAVLRKAMILA
ncbi:DJ-1/PfpI family protein [Bacillota bacterium]